MANSKKMPQVATQVATVRAASRSMVRELGVLGEHYGGTSVTQAQCHALLELMHRGVLTAGQLAERLRIDKSSASRTIAQLLNQGYVTVRKDASDRRRKPLALTAAGSQAARKIDALADRQVQAALLLISSEDRQQLAHSLQQYVKALCRSRLQRDYSLRPIQKRDNPAVMALIRSVMTEQGASGTGFAIHDEEVTNLWTAYSDSHSAYFVMVRGDQIVGGGGVAPLAGGDRGVCELKKMYFLPETRGLGLGARMLSHCLDTARDLGYTLCYLETLDTMERARRLYQSFGFRPLDAPLGMTGHFGCDRWFAKPL